MQTILYEKIINKPDEKSLLIYVSQNGFSLGLISRVPWVDASVSE